MVRRLLLYSTISLYYILLSLTLVIVSTSQCISPPCLLKHLLLLRLYYWRIAFWQIDFTSLHYVLPFLLDRKFDLHWKFDRGSWVDRWINSTLLLHYVNSYIILGTYLYVFVWSWKVLSKSISLFDFTYKYISRHISTQQSPEKKYEGKWQFS